MSRIIVKAGREERADVNYDEQPGADILTTDRLLLQYDPQKVIYLDTVSGNDAASGFSEIAPKLTFNAAAAALGGSRDTIHVINDGARIDVPITAPVQMKQGLRGYVSMGAAHRRYNGITYRAATSIGQAPIVYEPGTNKIGLITSGGFAYSNNLGNTWQASPSVSQITWVSYRHPMYVPEVQGWNPYVTKNRIVVQRIGQPDLVTFQTVIAEGAVGQWGIQGISYAPRLGQYVGVGVGEPGAPNFGIYISTGYPQLTGWRRLHSAVIASYIAADMYVAWVVEVAGYLIAMMYDGSTNGVLLQKAPTDADFSEVSVPFAIGYMKKVTESVAIVSTQGIMYETAVFRNGTWSLWPFTSNPQCLFDLEYDQYTDQFYAAGSNLNTGVDQRRIYVYDKNLQLLYSWENTVSTGSVTRVLTTPTRLFTNLWSQMFASYNLYSQDVVSGKIQANIAGFEIWDGDFSSGAEKILSCSKPIFVAQPREFVANRGRRAKLTNNQILAQRNLFTEEVEIVASPANIGDVKIFDNTILGSLVIKNTAATSREKIESNIVEGGVRADFPVVVSSGNYRGAHSNAIFKAACIFADPKFIDIIDCKLQRRTLGYDAQSPCIGRSPERTNSQGQWRDFGAWSSYETNHRYTYRRTFEFLKPMQANAIKHKKNVQANLLVSLDATPDVFNNPDSQWEEIELSYGSLPNVDVGNAVRNHVAFIDYMDSLIDTTCMLYLDPEVEPAETITVNGLHNQGSMVLEIQPAPINGGDRIAIAGRIYYALYVHGNYVVLDRPTHVAILNGTVLSVYTLIGGGTYQYVPSQQRVLTRWHSDSTEWLRGAVLRFVRKLT